MHVDMLPAGAGWFHGRGYCTDTWTPGTFNIAASTLTPAILDAATVKSTLVTAVGANEFRLDTHQLLTMYPYYSQSGNSNAAAPIAMNMQMMMQAPGARCQWKYRC